MAVVCIVFALVLLAKIVLWVTIGLYGFALALPATLVLMAIMLGTLPNAVDRRGGCGALIRAAWLGPVVVFAAASLNTDQQFFAAKTLRVGRGADAIYAYPE